MRSSVIAKRSVTSTTSGRSTHSLSTLPTTRSRPAARTPRSQSGTTRSKSAFVNTRATTLPSLRWHFRQTAHAWLSARAIRGTRARRARVRLSGPRSSFVNWETRSRWVFYFERPCYYMRTGPKLLFFCSRRDGVLAEREDRCVVSGGLLTVQVQVR